MEPEGNPLVVATRDEPAEALLGGTGIICQATQLPNLLNGGLDVVDVEVGHDLPGVVARVQPGSSFSCADHRPALTHGLERPPQKGPVETLGRVASGTPISNHVNSPVITSSCSMSLTHPIV